MALKFGSSSCHAKPVPSNLTIHCLSSPPASTHHQPPLMPCSYLHYHHHHHHSCLASHHHHHHSCLATHHHHPQEKGGDVTSLNFISEAITTVLKEMDSLPRAGMTLPLEQLTLPSPGQSSQVRERLREGRREGRGK